MPNWRQRVKIKDIISAHPEQTDVAGAACARALAARLRVRLPECPYIDDFDHADTQDECNDALEDLYDWADEDHRVWFD